MINEILSLWKPIINGIMKVRNKMKKKFKIKAQTLQSVQKEIRRTYSQFLSQSQIWIQNLSFLIHVLELCWTKKNLIHE